MAAQTTLSKEKDILEFIETKKYTQSKINIIRTYKLCCKIIKNSLLDSYKEIDKEDFSLICCDIVFNIFWILIFHTYNIKLTMFLCERAIVLYNEYITMLKTAFSDDIIRAKKIKIKITDVKLFIYNKTIGPLKLLDKRSKTIKMNQLIIARKACIDMKILIQHIFIKEITTKSDDKIGIVIDNCISQCMPRMYKLYLNYGDDLLISIINNIIINNPNFFDTNNSAYYINKFKVYIDILYGLLDKYKNIKVAKEIFSNKYMSIDFDNYKKDLEKYYTSKSLLTKKFYKNLILI